jgi:hypothetical protein
MKRAYIGIDPGSAGCAVCIADDEVRVCRFSNCTEKEVWDFFNSLSFDYECVAVLELVHSMPGDGGASAFTFGHNAGVVEGFLIAASIPYQKKTPQTWMKYYNIKREIVRGEDRKEIKEKSESKTDFKRRLRTKAEQLYPNIKMTNDQSDAVLIANFCKNTY